MLCTSLLPLAPRPPHYFCLHLLIQLVHYTKTFLLAQVLFLLKYSFFEVFLLSISALFTVFALLAALVAPSIFRFFILLGAVFLFFALVAPSIFYFFVLPGAVFLFFALIAPSIFHFFVLLGTSFLFFTLIAPSIFHFFILLGAVFLFFALIAPSIFHFFILPGAFRLFRPIQAIRIGISAPPPVTSHVRLRTQTYRLGGRIHLRLHKVPRRPHAAYMTSPSPAMYEAIVSNTMHPMHRSIVVDQFKVASYSTPAAKGPMAANI